MNISDLKIKYYFISLALPRAFISTQRNYRGWLEKKATKMLDKGSNKLKKISEAITVAMLKKKKKKRFTSTAGMDFKLGSKNLTHKPVD